MTRRSIGIFTYSTRPRGSVVHACYLAESLAERGHDVTLYALSKAGDELYRELSCPVVLLPAEPAPAYRRQFADELARLPEELRRRIVQLGPVSDDELTALYRMSQVLLCASLQEGFGLCVLEALASGAAAVVSRGEPFTEYLDDSCASFVEPASPKQIDSAVSELLQQPALRAERAVEGLARARRYSWQRVVLEHERLYAELDSEPPLSRRVRPSQEPSYA